MSEPATPARSTETPPKTDRRRLPAWFPRVVAESVLIVFSVLLALAVDQWREAREERERAEIALAAIAAEVGTNRADAARAMAFHRENYDRLRAETSGGGQVSEETALQRGMLQPARVLATAWTSARESGALQQLPYDLVLEISRVYDWQTRYVELTNQLVADIYNDMRRRGVEQVLQAEAANFIILCNDLSNREAALVERYDRLQERLREQLGTDAEE